MWYMLLLLRALKFCRNSKSHFRFENIFLKHQTASIFREILSVIEDSLWFHDSLLFSSQDRGCRRQWSSLHSVFTYTGHSQKVGFPSGRLNLVSAIKTASPCCQFHPNLPELSPNTCASYWQFFTCHLISIQCTLDISGNVLQNTLKKSSLADPWIETMGSSWCIIKFCFCCSHVLCQTLFCSTPYFRECMVLLFPVEQTSLLKLYR